MDVRLSPEQQALRNSAAQLIDALAPRSVADLDDAERTAKLDAAVESVGWRELRADNGDGEALASAVDTALVAEELARGLADTSFLGPTLAAELRRLAGAPAAGSPETVLLVSGLSGLASLHGGRQSGVSDGAWEGSIARGQVAVDARGCSSALVLAGGEQGGDGPSSSQPAAYQLASVALPEPAVHVDLTRALAVAGEASPVHVAGQQWPLTAEHLTRWSAFALAMTCADLVGTMYGALHVSCEYAKIRRQYGTPIGAFQAIQHLLADAFVAAEGSRSVALHAAWAADVLPAAEARTAAAVAKAYCSRAARLVCETAIQVHGGIGNTWECIAHVYLRRALLSSQVLGGESASVAHVMAHYGITRDDIGDGDGLR
jgi:alkylation response protein AidB-like acyl-CoA dehydrogenase